MPIYIKVKGGDDRMRITDIFYSDFSLLVDGYIKAKTEKSVNTSYGSKATSYFENMFITFSLCDLSFIELIGLKSMCSNIIPIKISTDWGHFDITKESPIKEEYDDRIKKITRGLYTLSTMDRSTNKYPFEYDGLLLTGHYSFDVLARFEGCSIMSILGMFPESKFYNKEIGQFEVPEKSKLEDMLIRDFLKNLYSTIETKISTIDILTDIMFDTKFFSYVNSSTPVQLSHINTAIGEFRLLNNTQIRASEELRILNQNLNEFQLFYNGIDDFTYHVVINSSLQTFLTILLFSNFIYGEKDIKFIYGSDSLEYYIPDSLDSVTTRMESFLRLTEGLKQDIIKITKKESEKMNVSNVNIQGNTSLYGDVGTQTTKNQTSAFDRYGVYKLIPVSTYISYTLKFKKSEFEKFGKLIPTTYNTSELSGIIDKISNTILTIEKYFDK